MSTAARRAVVVARVFVFLSILALAGAWIAEMLGSSVFGMTQQHLFNDAIVLALLGIAWFADAYWHDRDAAAPAHEGAGGASATRPRS